MVDIQALVNKGITQAAFKYKANAEKFMQVWEKKGYHVEYMKSSGPVVDDTERCPSAYYVIADKETPEPMSKKDQKMIAEYERLERWERNDPRGYWLGHIKPRLIKHKKHVDPEIYQLIIELNDNNLFTLESCAGHGKDDPGILFFKRTMFDGTKARAIMKKHGLTGIYREEKPYISSDGVRYIIYRFNAIGKPKRRR
jgi:hypothetical protein